ncbi:MAG: sigma-54-dependent Fis family transcriptional regulator [Spirochaetes bacterium GWD1_27_9]|nr:MAG: sigma-54-dependent Fis family transcriptional regulator [Spirochaetes bacterium GWB1_27_13]OHD25960.1 MAG: sigma-54-dependent Fis family transcriptional regulator [Spirochaetes bacterium GWC1_27_15]OHD43513.1 MAG: sigma-54-dependent Fis family transcriptional regulator [Spirochaetes bacterium GWD1_27_9]
MENNYQYSYEELSCLHEINSLIIKESDLNKALKETLNILSEKMNLKRGIISIYHKDLNEIHHDTYGFQNPEDKIKYLPGEGITGEVVKTGRPIAIPRLDKAPIFLDKTGIRKNLNREELAFICVPIKYKDETIGALSVDSEIKQGEEDLTNEVKFLETVSYTIAEIVNKKIMISQNQLLKEIIQKSNPLGTIVGNSKSMRELSYQISLIADSNVSVLIMGETGTGKELVAKEIHNLSPRKNGPFITINCGAIPEGLIESELFGHKKGAFTGAINDRIGKFEAANNGTLFLDEIGELSLMLQVKLLRALQEREITPVGSNNNIKVNVRIIAATNRNLEEEIENNRFRADLYYRLNVFQLYLPPLRERGADIILLADYFIKRYSNELNKNIERIDTPAIDMLMSYHWPGNVRELENCIERASLLAKGNTIHAHDLPPSLQMKIIEDNFEKRGKFESLVRAYEIELITDALKDGAGNQTKAAELLETTKRIIQYKITQYGIDYRKFAKGKK